MSSRNKNRNEGTFACSPGTRTRNEGTFAKTTLFRNRPLSPNERHVNATTSRSPGATSRTLLTCICHNMCWERVHPKVCGTIYRALIGSQKCKYKKKVEENKKKHFQIIFQNTPPKYCKIQDDPHRLFLKRFVWQKIVLNCFFCLSICFFPSTEH